MIHENTVKFKFYFSVTVCVRKYLQVSMYVCADLCKSKGSSWVLFLRRHLPLSFETDSQRLD